MGDEIETHLALIKYFWDQNKDVTDYSEFYRALPELKEKRPAIAMVIENYISAKTMMNNMMEKL